ncbi:hypothetical protein [Rothia koreensis]|uniref:hypothetical protein n=1 Tax=Rothia koreensis TaxID=592378 RepID=UPI003FCD6765
MPLSDPIVTISRGSDTVVLGPRVVDGFLLGYGSTGLGIGPVDIQSVPIPAAHGSLLRHRRVGEREVFLPVHVFGDSFQGCDMLRDRLYRLCDPVAGPVRISVTSKTRDAGTRWADVYYAGGLEGDYSGRYNGTCQSFGLKFKMLAPFWSADPVERMWQIAPGVKPFLSTSSSFFPVVLTSSSITGDFIIHVEGDQPVAPIWSVSGPGADLRIQTPAGPIGFSGEIKEGQIVCFDTARGDVYDQVQAQGQLWSRVSLDTRLGSLEPAANHVQVRFTGASPASQLTLSYRPQYLSAY